MYFSLMLPKGLNLLDWGSGFDGLCEAIGANPASGEAVSGGGLPTGVDLVSLCGSVETIDLAATLGAAYDAGVPVACVVYGKELAALPGEDRPRHYTMDGFEAVAAGAGFEVKVQLIVHHACLYLLTPIRSTRRDAWWLQRPAAGLLKRHGRRGRRQREKFRLSGLGGNWEFHSDKWRERADVAARLAPVASRIMDIGCGAMYLEAAAQPSHYVPVDIGARDGRTRIIDLNRSALGADWLAEVDFVFLLGVFEYLHDPGAVLAQCAQAGKRVVCTYNIAEGRTDDGSMPTAHWLNTYSAGQMEAIFEAAGLAVALRLRFYRSQMIWLLSPRPLPAPRIQAVSGLGGWALSVKETADQSRPAADGAPAAGPAYRILVDLKIDEGQRAGSPTATGREFCYPPSAPDPEAGLGPDPKERKDLKRRMLEENWATIDARRAQKRAAFEQERAARRAEREAARQAPDPAR
ncbi:hypothetical protein D3874_18305 [Oleomonas cavernae]|uniref:Uncharacterized protein n=2 Tax=Oleomonas cavernae TaxID=2320859 RepID=A0A418WFB0_9PROT|nr:hypothetical protein D3874_18305 [Oleomonas cavernae]